MTLARHPHLSSRAAPFGAVAASAALHASVALGMIFGAPKGGPSRLVWVDVARVAVTSEPPPPDPPKQAPEPPKQAPEPPKQAPIARKIADAPRPPEDEPPAPAPTLPPQEAPQAAPSAGPGPELAGASANGSGVASTDGGTGLGGPVTPTAKPGAGSAVPLPAPVPETSTAPRCPPPRVSYPAEARRRSLEGEVTAHIVVGEDGRIGDARIVRSAGPTLDDAVLAVVRAMRCEPARLGSRAVSASIPYTVRFVLEDP